MGFRGRAFPSLAASVTRLLQHASLVALALCLPASSAQDAGTSEVKSQETEPSFKLQVQRNLVVVRVVVRDSKGRPVSNLRKDDFRLFDNGKPQGITSFTVETPPSKAATAAQSRPQAPATEPQPETATAPFTPLRYLAAYFDDVHAHYEDLVRTRDAADRYLVAAVRPGDRVGVFTSSGQNMQDFTDDLQKVHAALFGLRPRPIVPDEMDPCPDVFPYQAYLIVEQRDSYAIDEATLETLQCRYQGDTRFLNQAQQDAESEAVRVLTRDESQSQYSFRELDQLVRRMGTLPGQRHIIFVSPGFLTETQKYTISEIIDRALRNKVIVNTFDSKGLFAPIPLGDASKRVLVVPQRPDLMGHKAQDQLTSYQRDVEVLAQLAYDTGGVFFHNSNDYDEGFRRTGALVETYYVLGFSPQNLKPDGRFHTLKVSLAGSERLTVQARRGYFAPKKAQDLAALEKEDLEGAIFSQDELNGLPVDVHTQFFKVSERDTKLSVIAHLDLHLVRFRKEQGRNLNNLTFVTALFDRDGKYVTAQQKRLEFHLRDSSLERLSRSGITTKASFDVPPGTYLVREVVRDAEAGQISGLNRTVEIPY